MLFLLQLDTTSFSTPWCYYRLTTSNLNVVTYNYTHVIFSPLFFLAGKWWWLQWTVKHQDGSRWDGTTWKYEGKPLFLNDIIFLSFFKDQSIRSVVLTLRTCNSKLSIFPLTLVCLYVSPRGPLWTSILSRPSTTTTTIHWDNEITPSSNLTNRSKSVQCFSYGMRE